MCVAGSGHREVQFSGQVNETQRTICFLAPCAGRCGPRMKKVVCHAPMVQGDPGATGTSERPSGTSEAPPSKGRHAEPVVAVRRLRLRENVGGVRVLTSLWIKAGRDTMGVTSRVLHSALVLALSLSLVNVLVLVGAVLTSTDTHAHAHYISLIPVVRFHFSD